MQQYRVAVFSAQRYVKQFLQKPLLTAFPSSEFLEPRLDDQTARLAEGMQAVNIFVNDDAGAQVLQRLAQGGVTHISLRCAGYDRVDVAAAAALGMTISRVPTYSPTSVAEHAITLMLALSRNLQLAYARVGQGNYALSGLVGRELSHKTVGVIGTGRIGTEVCRMLQGFQCRLLAHDLHHNPTAQGLGVTYVDDVQHLLSESDVVTLHWPLLDSTRHFISRERLAQMKSGAMLINVSRGGLVDTEALIDSLQNGKLGYAGLDVYEREEELFFKDYTKRTPEERLASWDRRFTMLKAMPTCIVTPHIAFLTHEALMNIADTTIQNLQAVAAGRLPAPENQVNAS